MARSQGRRGKRRGGSGRGVLDPKRALRFFLRHDEHDVRMRIKASASAAAELSSGGRLVSSSSSSSSSASRKKKEKQKKKQGRLDKAEALEKMRNETSALCALLGRVEDLRRRLPAVGGTLETFLSVRVDCEVDVMAGVVADERKYANEGKSSARMLTNGGMVSSLPSSSSSVSSSYSSSDSGHAGYGGSGGSRETASDLKPSVPLVSSASLSKSRAPRIVSSRSRRIRDTAQKLRRSSSAAERALAAAGFTGKSTNPPVGISGNTATSSSGVVVSLTDVFAWLTAREAIAVRQAHTRTTDSRGKLVPSVPPFYTSADKERGQISKGAPSISRHYQQQHVSQQPSFHHPQKSRQRATAVAASTSAVPNIFSRSTGTMSRMDTRLPPRLLIGDRAGVSVRDLGAMFSARDLMGGRIGGGRRARTRIPLCPVPTLEPKLMAAVENLGLREELRQQPQPKVGVEPSQMSSSLTSSSTSSSSSSSTGANRRSRRRNPASSKFRRKLCKEDDREASAPVEVSAKQSYTLSRPGAPSFAAQHQKANRTAETLIQNQFTFMPLLATTDPGYRMTLRPRTKFALRNTRSLAGYCFCCHRHCDNLPQHLESDPTHRKFNAAASNFAELDHFLDAELYAGRFAKRSSSESRGGAAVEIEQPERTEESAKSYPNSRNVRTPASKRATEAQGRAVRSAEVTRSGAEGGNKSAVESSAKVQRHGRANHRGVKTPGTISTNKVQLGRLSKSQKTARGEERDANVIPEKILVTASSTRGNGQEIEVGAVKRRRKRYNSLSSTSFGPLLPASSPSLPQKRQKCSHASSSSSISRRSSKRQIKPVEQFNPSLPNQFAFFQGKYARRHTQPASISQKAISKAQTGSTSSMPTSGLSATSSTLTTSSLGSVSKVTQRKRPRRQIRPVEQFNPSLPNTHAFYGGKYASNAKHMHGKQAEFEASDVGGEASEWSFRFDLDRYRHDEESQEDEEYVPPSAEGNSFDEDSCSSGGDLELPELGQQVRWRWSLAGKKKGSAFGWFTGCVVGVDARSVSVRYDLDGETVSHDIASAHYGETWEEVGRLSAEQARDGVWVGEESSPRDMVVHSRPKRRRVAPELFQPGGDPRQTSFAIQDNGGLKEEQALRLAVRASLRT